MKRKRKAPSVPHLRVSQASRNVFADLGLEDVEELETKSKLVLQITDLIQQHGLTQTQAATRLNIDQPRVSDLFNGKLRGFSVYKLMHFVALLGRNVNIVTCNPAQPNEVEAIAIS